MPEASYVISTNTLILQTVRKESSLQTLIIEREQQFIHPRKVMHLIRASCRHYRTSFEVATKISRKVLDNRQKVPIVVAFDQGIPITMIPTTSTASEQNMWIALHAIAGFTSDRNGFTTIKLINHLSIKVEISESILNRQITLAYLLQRDYRAKYVHFNGPWINKPTN